MSDFSLGSIFGAILVALLMSGTTAALARLGLIHIGYGRVPLPLEPPPTPASASAAPASQRKFPRIGCYINVEEHTKLTAALKPQLRLFAILDNEGEVVVRSLKGYWRVLTPDNVKHPAIRIQRDVLAPQDKYLESYLMTDELETQVDDLRFDVEVEFDYLSTPDDDSRHFSAKYRYDRKTHRMVKIT
jgi:hypothetical protein